LDWCATFSREIRGFGIVGGNDQRKVLTLLGESFLWNKLPITPPRKGKGKSFLKEKGFKRGKDSSTFEAKRRTNLQKEKKKKRKSPHLY